MFTGYGVNVGDLIEIIRHFMRGNDVVEAEYRTQDIYNLRMY